MKVAGSGTHVTASEIVELNASNAASVRDAIVGGLLPGTVQLDIDLSQTAFIDSAGIGALIAVQRQAGSGTKVRLLHPNRQIRQLLELMQLQRIFEIL